MKLAASKENTKYIDFSIRKDSGDFNHLNSKITRLGSCWTRAGAMWSDWWFVILMGDIKTKQKERILDSHSTDTRAEFGEIFFAKMWSSWLIVFCWLRSGADIPVLNTCQLTTREESFNDNLEMEICCWVLDCSKWKWV